MIIRTLITFIFLFIFSALSPCTQADSFHFFPEVHTLMDEIGSQLQGGAFVIVGDNLPTQVIKGAHTPAYFTVTNNTSSYLRNNFVHAIPNNTQLVTSGTGICGSRFDLAPHASCQIKLFVSGDVNNIPELFVYNEDGSARTGYNQPWNVTGVPTSSITVTPATSTLYIGQTEQYQATAYSADHAVSADISTIATWSSSDGNVASVNSSTGNVSANGAGSATITATFQGISGLGLLTIDSNTLNSITVTPANITLAINSTKQYKATGNYSDGTTKDLTNAVTWESSDETVASITASGGSATALSGGTTTISASLVVSGTPITGTTSLNVTNATLQSIHITPSNPSVAVGIQEQFKAIGTFSDGKTHDITTAVSWGSKDTSVATISNTSGSEGLATAIATGSSLITATDPSTGITGNTTLTVSGKVLTSIRITPVSPTLVAGSSATPFTATGTYSDGSTDTITNTVTWATGDHSILTVSNTSPTQGYATPGNIGSTSITATDPSTLISGTTPVSVTEATLTSLTIAPSSANVPKGTTQAYIATGTLSNGRVITPYENVTWSVINPSSGSTVASIDSDGVATALARSGTATIQATSGSLVASATLTAQPPTLYSITMNPTSYSVGPGLTSQPGFAVGTYSDGIAPVTNAIWDTGNHSIATATGGPLGTGTVTGVSADTTTVTAHLGDIYANPSATVTVKTIDHIAISPATQTIPVLTSQGTNGVQQYSATVYYTDGTSQDVTGNVAWSSSNTQIATISNASGSQGLATAVSQNAIPVTITAQLGGSSGTASLTVGGPAPTGLTVSPDAPTIGLGATQQFTAKITFADGSSSSYTSYAGLSWQSLTPAVATIDASNGLATSVATGTTSIIATYQETFGDLTYTVSNGACPAILTVTGVTLTSIAISPSDPNVPVGTSTQFTALGTYSDHSTQDVTDQATWTSSDTTIVASPLVVVDASTGDYALAPVSPTATVGHSTTITAQVGSVSGTTSLTAGSAVITGITVTPSTSTITFPSTPVTYTALATESNNTSGNDVTSLVTWSSTTPNVVSLGGTYGNVASPGTVLGTTTIKATSTNNVVGTASLTLAPTGTVVVGGYSTSQSITPNIPYTYTLGTYPSQTTPFYISNYILPLNAAGTVMNAVTCIPGTSSCLAIQSNPSNTSLVGYVFQSLDNGLTWSNSPIFLAAPIAGSPLVLTGIACLANSGTTYCHISGYYTQSGIFYPIVYSSSNSGASWNSGVTLTLPSSHSIQLTGVSCSAATQVCDAIGNDFVNGSGLNEQGSYYSANNGLNWGAAQGPFTFATTHLTVNAITTNSLGDFIVAGQFYIVSSETTFSPSIYAQTSPGGSWEVMPVTSLSVSAAFNGVSCAGSYGNPNPNCIAVGYQTATGALAPTAPIAMANSNYGNNPTSTWTIAANGLTASAGQLNAVSCSATTGACLTAGKSYTNAGSTPLVMISSGLTGANWSSPSNTIINPSQFVTGAFYGIAQTTS